LTVLENIRFFAEVRGLSSGEWLPRCMEILHFVGLADFTDRRAGQLSGGMKQKLGLASALVTRPRVLLLDEPTTGVDPVTRQDFWQLIIRLVAGQAGATSGVAVLLSTPYMDEASRCSRIGFMAHGSLIAEGTPAQLRERLTGRVLELRGAPLAVLRQTARQDPDVEDVQAFGDRLHLRVRENAGPAVTKRLPTAIGRAGGSIDGLRPVPVRTRRCLHRSLRGYR
jgi:ABC-2 type transport system ATP-binding protein